MEHFQIYLTRRVQDHFGIPAKMIKPDSQAKIPDSWHTLWRIDHLTANSDGSQHLFLVTNATSLFSFIIPLNDEEDFNKLISLFYQHWFDIVLFSGLFPPVPIKTATEYLRGRPNSLIGTMNMFVQHALDAILDKGEGVKEAHARLRNIPVNFGGDWIFPSEKFAELLIEKPPYPNAPPDTRSSAFLN